MNNKIYMEVNILDNQTKIYIENTEKLFNKNEVTP